MLQTLEAVITQSGWVKFNEPFTLEHSVKAYVTILPNTTDELPESSSGQSLLQVLDSAAFSQSPFGESDSMEKQIQANRNAWND
ncbi:hypothetical protein [Thiomicrospira microaerophila]|uniref:hypothetical protein n=1 Tax=Thiomicrospira microaerophila TaxID=406020 RepID=UPI0005CA568B|nr:hypothetical protein [Thiomicrospira microaerophila]